MSIVLTIALYHPTVMLNKEIVLHLWTKIITPELESSQVDRLRPGNVIEARSNSEAKT